MSKSTVGTAGTGTGPKANAKRGEQADKKEHLIVPDLNLGGDDDDEDEDDFRPVRAFVPPTTAKPPAAKAVVPPQQGEESERSPVADEPEPSPTASPVTVSPTPTPGPAALHGELGHSAGDSAENGRETSHGSGEPSGGSVSDPSSLDGASGRPTVEVQEAPTERTAELARVDRHAAPALRTSASLSGLPARRPGRRRPAEPFNPDEPRQRNEQAMLELSQQAPGYASLLTVYSASQLNAVPFENRNINLYGLTADQVGTQRTADMALLKMLTFQRPKLTPAHYVDAALEPVLKPLDPDGIDMEAMEDERDYVWQLAQKGLAYRRYILGDPESANMDNYRPVCSLRKDVNARLTRMMDLMDSIQGIQAKPFEIVSACLAEYIASLPGERTHLSEFFQKHLVTTIQ
ncbi:MULTISPECIES: hypothetical protein [unclassified Streptomyces]|uniref:hypothetical protein n=1 Tax=unclassified Streptomyces TaxID=2593676 RepID=UPI0003D7B8D8|nr:MULTISPECIES: hypothetical protein [unclassified Streptomyces]AHE40019.1 hypothetical protein pFRL5_356c [Streptomyces sp. F8]